MGTFPLKSIISLNFQYKIDDGRHGKDFLLSKLGDHWGSLLMIGFLRRPELFLIGFRCSREPRLGDMTTDSALPQLL